MFSGRAILSPLLTAEETEALPHSWMLFSATDGFLHGAPLAALLKCAPQTLLCSPPPWALDC